MIDPWRIALAERYIDAARAVGAAVRESDVAAEVVERLALLTETYAIAQAYGHDEHGRTLFDCFRPGNLPPFPEEEKTTFHRPDRDRRRTDRL